MANTGRPARSGGPADRTPKRGELARQGQGRSQSAPGSARPEHLERHEVFAYSGPIPEPATLARYNAIVPGSADRIINRFEKQSDHRMQLESLAIRGDDRRANRGQWFAFLLALVGILASTYIIVSGHSVAGTILFGGTLLELVTTFIYGAETRRRERQQKNRRLQE